MEYKYIPFYMQGVPINEVYANNFNVNRDKDMEYVKEMYPRAISRLQEIVEQILDRQEFVGSMIYDEYPDKMGIYRMVNDVFKKVKEDEAECKGKDCIKYPDDNWLKDIIRILLLHEMYRRRKKKQSRWYF